MISENIIKAGECVPSIRKMSKLYNVSATPVIEAYKNLERLGILESHPKSRFVVACDDIASLPSSLTLSEYLDNPAQLMDETVPESPFRQLQSEVCLNYCFSKPSIYSELIPGEEIVQFISRHLKTYPQLIDVDPHGYDDKLLVEAISKWMLQYKCIINEKEIVIVNNNITTPLILALQSSCRRDQALIIASPCPKSHRYVARLRGHKVVSVRSTPEGGLDLDALERAIDSNPDAACLLVSPCYAGPTGSLMSESAKNKLVDICVKHDIVIIEDDSNGDLCYESDRPSPIKSLAPDRTIYISSFSNSLAPGLQINWACPGKYVKAYRYYRDAISSAPPAMLQAGFGAYTQSKLAKKHLGIIRGKLKDAIELTRNAVHEFFPPNTFVSNPGGGYDIWISLPPGLSAEKLKQEAQKTGISIVTGEECSVEGANLNCFTINCSAVARDRRKLEGIRILGELAHKLQAIHESDEDQVYFSGDKYV